MMGRTHKIGGAVMGFAILNALIITSIFNINPIFATIPFLAANVIGALLPDIDSINSTISRILWFVAIPIFIIQKILSFFLRNSKSALAKNIKRSVNHRGFAHWPSLYLTFIIIITIAYSLTPVAEYSLTLDNVIKSFNGIFPTDWIIPEITRIVVFSTLYGFCTGALSHILLDAFNFSGVPLFAPFSFKRKSFMNITTGRNSKGELRFKAVLKVILALLIVLFVGLNATKMMNIDIPSSTINQDLNTDININLDGETNSPE